MRCLLNKSLVWPLLAIALLWPESSRAIPITFTVNSLGGNSYRYTYNIGNDGSLPGGVSVELFDILFPTNLYDESSLKIVSSPALSTDWSQIILASAPGVPAAFDVSAITGGIPVGDSVSGFAVQFAWLGGTDGPASQVYQVFNPNTFKVLQSGTTTPEQPSGVPEPSALMLLSVGLLLAWPRTVRRGRLHR
jgi:hypothetical protein